MKEIKQNSPHAWLLAARPKTLTGAIIPVMIGTSLAFADGQFKIVPALLCMLFACGMQIAANFINDLFDFQKGTDRREDRLGPQRACADAHHPLVAARHDLHLAADHIRYRHGFRCVICAILRGLLAAAEQRQGHHQRQHQGKNSLSIHLRLLLSVFSVRRSPPRAPAHRIYPTLSPGSVCPRFRRIVPVRPA